MSKKSIHHEKFINIRRDVLVCFCLVIATLVVYGKVRNHSFINFDDHFYVSENRHVKAGVTVEGLSWAFRFPAHAYWHPLTWLSHMMDCELYGLDPGLHHLTSVFFHIANSLLLFLLFRWMTGAVWRSAFIAAVFAVHPLNVDSVAWVSERKNVLSTFFWMLAILVYWYYTRRPGFSRYLLLLVVFSLGLLAKPMLVTFPFLLLLLDYWPLERIRITKLGSQKSIAFRLVMEKIPILILSVVTIGIISLWFQERTKMITTEMVPMKLRIENALVSYVSYIGKMIWPQNLTFFYPFPSEVPMWQVAGAGLLLLSVTILVIRCLKEAPYLGVGWLWYLGTLFPVIGLIQGGLWPEMADRWAYVPLVGLFIIIAWGVPELLGRWRYRKVGLAVFGGAVLLIMIATSRVQVGYWTNSITLCEHALGVTSNNSVAHYNLGVALAEQGRTAEAMYHYREVLRISPNYVDAYNNLGNALKKEGLLTEAIRIYNEALRIDPDYEKAHNNLGNALAKLNKTADAIYHYSEALRINPEYVDAHNNLGNALAREGRTSEAINQYSEALQIDPDSYETQINLGNALVSAGRLDEGIKHYTEVVRLNPGYAEGHNYLGVALVRKGMIEEAVSHFREALRIRPDYQGARDNLEKILAVKKRLNKALEGIQKN
jgi:tetratricopeptide (TPR) repeat protein